MTSLAAPSASLVPSVASVHVFPTSAQQQRFWLLDQIDGEGTAYTIPVALRLDGPLDAALLARALELVVDRHEVLRTVFAMESDGPVQIVRPDLRPTLAVEDLRALGAEDAESAVRRAASENANAAFDLGAGPLVRARLLRLGVDRHVLLLALHHAVADGTSLGLLFGELRDAYAAFLAGHEPALPELPLQYADYAVWQRRALDGRSSARQLDYWAGRLASVAPLELPTTRARPAVQSLAGLKREARLSAETAESVRTLARAHGVTPYVACLAAYVALLHRYSAQSDFAVGAITAGRTRPELEALIGPFVNTLALRVAPDPARPFAELLTEVRDVVAAGMANGAVPFERVVERVQPVRDRSRSPLFQVAFQLLDGVTGEPRLEGVQIASVPAAKETAKFDLTLIVRSSPDGGLVTVAEYSTALFDEAAIDRMLAHYATLLAAAVRDPSVPVGRLSMLGETERALVSESWNASAEPLPTWTVASRILEQAVSTPDLVAVRSSEESITYRELARRSAIVARRLGALGVRAGDRVAVCVDRTTTLPVALLGVLRAGAAYVPIDAAYPAERIAQVLEDARVAAVLTDNASRDSLPSVDAPLERLDDATWRADVGEKERDASPAIDGEALAYVLFTSGSTGRPKGVMIPHRALANFLESMLEAPGLAAGDALVAVTTISFDIAGLELWLPLVTGAEVVLASRATAVDGHALRALLDRTAASVAPHHAMLQATPATWRLLLEAGWSGAPNVVMLCGGEAWPAGLAAALRARGAALWNVYGPTETTIWSTRALVTGDDVSLGEPLANTTLHVLEPSGEPAPLGVPGELWIGGAGLALGYLGRDDLTSERFVEHERFGRLYRTGDRVRRSASGRLEYLGRLDDQVKVRGFRIELGEIEAVLASHDAVTRAVAAVHRGDDGGDARLAGYVVLVDGADEPQVLAELDTRLRRALPDYMVPSAIVRLDALPLTPNGKVNRRALPVPTVAQRATREYLAPSTALEQTIADAWSAVLGVERLGRDDDFFALGGHSLAAMRVVARLSTTLPARVTVGQILAAPTVRALAESIERREATTAPRPAPIQRRSEASPAPLSYAQELLWVHEQMAPGSATYNMPMARRVRGPLDRAALQRAVDAVVARHEALRTRIVETETGPRQIATDARVHVEVVSLPGKDLAAREAEALQRVGALASEPFELSLGPPLRIALLPLAMGEAILLVVTHHVVFDGGSVDVFFADLASAYDAARAGHDATLPAAGLQMADVAAWERSPEGEVATADALAFWSEHLDGAPSRVELPTDAPRTSAVTGPGARVAARLPGTLRDGVWRVAREHGATPFMVLLAAFQTLLHRYSGQADLVVGTPTARRTEPATQALVGNLATALAMRARIDEDATFAELLARVRAHCLRAFEHDALPYERLVRELRTTRGSDLASLFDVLFVFQERGTTLRPFGEATLEAIGIDLGTAKFDVSLSITDLGDGLRAMLEFRSDLFEPATMTAMLGHLETLLGAIVDAPASRIDRLTLMGSAERALLLASSRGRHVRRVAPSLDALILDAASRAPHSPAVRDADATLTYSELDRASTRIAETLRANGVSRGALVAIVMERRREMVAAMLGVLRAGAAYVPIDPSYPPARVRHMVDDADAALVLTQDSLRALTAGRAQLTIEELEASPTSPPTTESGERAGKRDPEDPAYVIYTSGSTGAPKGVVISHRAIVNHMEWMQRTFPLGPTDRVLQKTPVSFDASVWEFWAPLMAGAELVMATPGAHAEPVRLVREVLDQEITILQVVPSVLVALLEIPELAACRALRRLFCGGEPLHGTTVRSIRALLDVEVHNLYGPAETTIDATVWSVEPDLPRDSTPIVSIGRPIDNVATYVLAANFEPQPVGVAGELYIGGAGVGSGYHGQPTLTADRFMPDPFEAPVDGTLYRTGDRARWRIDGQLEYLGRIDDQVKLRGVRIELAEVERALLDIAGVTSAACRVFDAERGPYLVAYVSIATALSAPTIRAALATTLPAAMLPARVVLLESIPLTPNGKIDRRALPVPTDALLDDAPLVAPRDAVEAVVAGVWGEVLGRTPIGVETSFLDLGGHSLLATRVVSQIARIFRTTLPLRRFFEAPTVAGIARALVESESAAGRAEAIARAYQRVQQMSPEEREQLRRAKARSAQQPD